MTSDGFTVSVRVEEVAGAARWSLSVRGRWRTEDDVLLSDVTGSLEGGGDIAAATGRVEFWPRRVLGLGPIIGPSRIVLDIASEAGRLSVDGEVPPPPYLGITLPGHLDDVGGHRDVRVSIDPAQLVGLWLAVNRLPP